MNIETLLSDLKDAITENNSLLREVLAAGEALPTPSSVITMPESPKPAKKQKVEKPPVVEPEPVAVIEPKMDIVVEEIHEPEPVVVVEEAPDIELPESPEEPATETTLDPETLIAEITDAWKAQLTAADPTSRKVMLKDKFPELRAKWGLAADAKLITLAPTPEKLAGLLADIKTL